MFPVYYLLHPDEMPSIMGLKIPQKFYCVLRQPAPLASITQPGAPTPWVNIAKAGFVHVVILIEDNPPYEPGPLRVLCSVHLQDLLDGGNTILPRLLRPQQSPQTQGKRRLARIPLAKGTGL
jgi:hypothetical protein